MDEIERKRREYYKNAERLKEIDKELGINKGYKDIILVIVVGLFLMFLVSEVMNPAGFFGVEKKELPEPAVYFDFDNASEVLAAREGNDYYPGVLDELDNRTFKYNPSELVVHGVEGNHFEKGDYIQTANKSVPAVQTQDKITYVVKFRTDSDSDEYMGLFSNQMDWDSNSIQIKQGAILFKQAIKDENNSGASCSIKANHDYTDGNIHTAVFSVDAGANPDCRAYVDGELIGTHNTDAAPGHFWWENWEGFVIGATVGTENRTLQHFYEGEIIDVEVYKDSIQHDLREPIVLKGLHHTARINGDPEAVEGKYGDALYFDGDDNIEINFSYQPGSFTQMAWIYSENETFGHSKIDYDGRWISRNVGETGGLHIMGDGSAGYRLQYEDNTKIHHRPATVYLNNWHHLAVTYDNSTNELKVYLNGKLEGTKELENATLKDWRKIYIGGEGSYWFTGNIDDFIVYERGVNEDVINAAYKGKDYYFDFDKNVALAGVGIAFVLVIVLSFIQWKNGSEA